MPLFARAVFKLVSRWATRRGLLPEDGGEHGEGESPRARRLGLRGETFAYWYLRSRGYTLVRRNYRVPHRRGEIDLIGWDGKVLVFVEVKTRTTETGGPPEESVDADQRRSLQAMARHYLARRRLGHLPCRFDLLAVEARPGRPPAVRLHRGAFPV